MTLYNLPFIFDECGFGDLPREIKQERLFNVSIDMRSGDLKLYILDESERFLYKVDRQGITRQYSGDDPQHGGSHDALERRLGCRFNPYEVVIDAVEEDVYYVYLDDAGPAQTSLFLAALCSTFGIEEHLVKDAINSSGAWRYASLQAAAIDRAVGLVKVPLGQGIPKIYTRPFLRGPGYPLDPTTRAFLCRLYQCDERQLAPFLQHAWIATELGTDRQVFVTQHHALLHRD